QMYKHDHISRDVLDSLKLQPVDMTNFAITAHDKGPAPYFRMELKKAVERILNQKEYLRSDGRPWNLDKDGLRIYTTLDPLMQAHAEQAVENQMSKLQPQFFKHWSYGQTPWTYGSDKNYVKLKQRHLDHMKMNSPRFLSMKSTMFDSLLLDIESTFDNLNFTLFTLEVLQSAKNDGEYFQD